MRHVRARAYSKEEPAITGNVGLHALANDQRDGEYDREIYLFYIRSYVTYTSANYHAFLQVPHVKIGCGGQRSEPDILSAIDVPKSLIQP